MKRICRKKQLLAAFLTTLMIFSLAPAPALAASATGTASATQGFNMIFVNLTDTSEFSANEADVETVANWTLYVTGGSQIISSVVKTGAKYVTITLSGPVAAGNEFTLDADDKVFAAGTESFAAPIPVNITVPKPATGTAAATAGAKDISVELSYGAFSSANAGKAYLWTLGGASAPGNPIASVTYVNATHVMVTLTHNIGAADEYTLTAMQPVFINAAVAPFAAPLSVALSAPSGTDITSKFDPDFLVWVRSAVGKTGDEPIYDTDVSGIAYLSVPGKSLASLAGIEYFTGLKGLYCFGNLLTALDVSALTKLTTLHCANNKLTSLNVSALTELTTLNCSGNLLTGLDVTGLTKLTTLDVSGNHMENEAAVTGLNITTTANFTFEPQNTAGNVCAIGGTEYATLGEALKAVAHNGTIILLKDFTQTGGATLYSKTVTIDLAGHTLDILNSGGVGLAVDMGGELKLTGAGALNVTGHGKGVDVNGNGASAAVTNVISDDVGASASIGGKLTISGNVTAHTTGVFASDINSEITVSGTVTTGGGAGASAANGAKVTAGGIVANNGTGAVAYGGGEVTVEGTITAKNYISVGASTKSIDDKTLPTTKTGYHTYTDGTSTVWVKENSPAANVCAIGTTEYPTLQAAVTAASAGDTIRFLGNYNYRGTGISIEKNLTFNLDGRIVNLSAAGIALAVNNAALTLSGAGELNVEGGTCGVFVSGAKGSATVTNASVTGMTESVAAFASGGGTLTVRGDADAAVEGSANSIGAVAQNGGRITIGGDVTGMYCGAGAFDAGSAIAVGGNAAALADSGIGAHARDGAAITVKGNVTGANGVSSQGYDLDMGVSIVNVTGNVTSTGEGGTGVFCDDGAHATVGGDVRATGAGYTFGVSMEGGESGIGSIAVRGGVTALAPDTEGCYPVGVRLYINRSGLGNYISGGTQPVITVGGSVDASKFGLMVSGGLVLVNGDVTSRDTYGAQVNNGEVIVDGEIYGPGNTYVDVGNSPRVKENYSFIDAKNYRVYQNTFADGTVHIVRVGGAPQTDKPGVVTNAVSNVTSSGASLSGSVTSDGGASVTERGFVFGTSANPTTAGGTKVTAGSGIGGFTGTLSGLAANTTYHVRAYATNSAGTSYGADRSFTTLSGGSGPAPGPAGKDTPIVVTVSVSGVTGGGALFTGNVLSGGGAPVTERGFIYGKGDSPSLSSGARLVSGSGTGGFTANAYGLEPDTTYYVRAYAVTGLGTAYGTVMSFKTAAAGVPNTGGSGMPWLGWLLVSAALFLTAAVTSKKTRAANRG